MSDVQMPLSGIRVIELGGGVAAGLCTHFLAGYGADVVQLGDPGLTIDEDTFLSRGKRRIDAVAELGPLLSRADIVVDGRSRCTPVTPTAEQIRERYPHAVVTAITPFGLTGPHRAHRVTNIVSFANGGLMSLTGERDRQPLQTGGEQAFMLGGLHAFAATVTAFSGAMLQGDGDLLDISMQECAASMLEFCGATWEYDGVLIERSGNTPRAEWGMYQALDGWAGVCALGRQVPALLDMLGLPHEERFLDSVSRITDARDELMAHVMVFMLEHTRAELVAAGAKNKVPLGAVRTPADLAANDSLIERGCFDEVDGGRLPGRPFPGLGWASLPAAVSSTDDAVIAEWNAAAAVGAAL